MSERFLLYVRVCFYINMCKWYAKCLRSMCWKKLLWYVISKNVWIKENYILSSCITILGPSTCRSGLYCKFYSKKYSRCEPVPTSIYISSNKYILNIPRKNKTHKINTSSYNTYCDYKKRNNHDSICRDNHYCETNNHHSICRDNQHWGTSLHNSIFRDDNHNRGTNQQFSICPGCCVVDILHIDYEQPCMSVNLPAEQ